MVTLVALVAHSMLSFCGTQQGRFKVQQPEPSLAKSHGFSVEFGLRVVPNARRVMPKSAPQRKERATSLPHREHIATRGKRGSDLPIGVTIRGALF